MCGIAPGVAARVLPMDGKAVAMALLVQVVAK